MKNIFMEENFQKIKILVEQSTLSRPEQESFMAILLLAPDEELEPLATLFAEDSSWIGTISENYKAKQAAFAGKSKAAWATVLEEEETLLRDITEEK